MKGCLKVGGIGCGVAVVAIALFIFWWSRHPIVFHASGLPELAGRQLAATRPGEVVIELQLSNGGDGFVVNEISCAREFAKNLGLSPPQGFREELTPLEDADRKNPALVESAKKWDAENIRWAGELPLPASSPVRLSFSAANADAAPGTIVVSFERRRRFGGMSAATRVAINQVPSAGAP